MQVIFNVDIMRFYTIILMFLLLPFTLNAQSDTLNRTDSRGRKQGYWKKYEKDKLQYEGEFIDDVPSGLFIYYHDNGNQKSRSRFIQGTYKVETVMYDINGKKSAEGIYIDQLKDGTWKYYAPNSTLIKVENYSKGIKNGLWQTFSPQSGVLLLEENYTGGKLNGEQKTYFTTGELNTRIPYIDGRRNGMSESFFPGEILSTKGMYYQNHRTGNWDYYDETGKLRKSTEYEKDRPVKSYLYLYNGSHAQKINQDLFAYVQKTGENKITLVTKNDKSQTFTEDYQSLLSWLDLVYFTPVSPSVTASYDILTGYEEVDDDTVKVKMRPSPSPEVLAKGDYAKIVKRIFNRELPVEEE